MSDVREDGGFAGCRVVRYYADAELVGASFAAESYERPVGRAVERVRHCAWSVVGVCRRGGWMREEDGVRRAGFEIEIVGRITAEVANKIEN